MIKIYEAVRQNRARLVFNYCNCTIKPDFINGNTSIGRNAEYRTNNPFIQDAIEKDPRFGVTIRLKGVIKEEGDDVPQPQAKPAAKAATKAKTKKQAEESKTFKNEADALYYLEQNFDIDVTGLEGDKLKAVLKAHDIIIEQ